jgi:hypothetical protein
MKTMDYIRNAEQRLSQNVATALIDGQMVAVSEMKLFVTPDKLLTSVHLFCEKIDRNGKTYGPREDRTFEALTPAGRHTIVTVLKTLK